jgi:RNA polymerase sigma factor (sigma-70 family)
VDQSALSTLFARYQQALHRRLRWIVNTSEANIEDACAHAWLQLVSYRPELGDPLTWLTTVAVREAVKLEHRSRRTRPLTRSDTGQELALVDRRLELELREELLDTAAGLTAAGLSDRQQRILGLLIAGYSYAEISTRTGESCRTVERQLHKARAAVRDSRGG